MLPIGFSPTGVSVSPGPLLRVDSASFPPRAPAPPEPRYYGLDAMCAATMVWVVVLHAALAYAQVPIPNLIWAVRDPAAHSAFDVLCWWALGISSPFFLMSGFFAAEIYVGKGSRGFLANRLKRIVGPLLVGGLFILPATFFVWVGGWLISGQASPREFLRLKFHADGFQKNLYGPAHLWSLEYLAVLLAAFWIPDGAATPHSLAIGRGVSRCGSAKPVACCIPVAPLRAGRSNHADSLGRTPSHWPRRAHGSAELLPPRDIPALAQWSVLRGGGTPAPISSHTGPTRDLSVNVLDALRAGLRRPSMVDPLGPRGAAGRPTGLGAGRHGLAVYLADHVRLSRTGLIGIQSPAALSSVTSRMAPTGSTSLICRLLDWCKWICFRSWHRRP